MPSGPRPTNALADLAFSAFSRACYRPLGVSPPGKLDGPGVVIALELLLSAKGINLHRDTTHPRLGGPPWVHVSMASYRRIWPKPGPGLKPGGSGGRRADAFRSRCGTWLSRLGEQVWPQSHRHRTRSRLLQLEETGRGGRPAISVVRPGVRRAVRTGRRRQAGPVRAGQRRRGHHARATAGLRRRRCRGPGTPLLGRGNACKSRRR